METEIDQTQMKKNNNNNNKKKKPRILCLHGFRTSGEILKKQMGRWSEMVMGRLDLVFLDGPCPAAGQSDVEGFFDPLYYAWFQFRQDFSEYMNFDECIAYIEDCMTRIGPFDGLLGFSQGALLSTALPGMQTEGVALTRLAENAFSSPIECSSLHFISEKDLAKPYAIELLDSFVDPFVIYHHEGHVVPKLDEKGLEVMLSFLEKIQKLL
ncbi:Rhodanese-like domain-containing protein 6 [Camellia lanceoleosa]|uniref:Rhodanese-like domain-containing protein 6 n=1 Tax=Camellia lanceoleosa TaxID=1840588 RepID=A0ACC0J2J3_9ERIC|nr:Rhodanese-like domain-containing protein 6 [Camellia lanceoleosa]